MAKRRSGIPDLVGDDEKSRNEQGQPFDKLRANGRRKTPRWTIAFLRALERTGKVQAAAADAGIDRARFATRRPRLALFA